MHENQPYYGYAEAITGTLWLPKIVQYWYLVPQMIWYDFGPIRKSGSIVSTLTLHSLTGTLKGPGSFQDATKNCGFTRNQYLPSLSPNQVWSLQNLLSKICKLPSCPTFKQWRTICTVSKTPCLTRNFPLGFSDLPLFSSSETTCRFWAIPSSEG